MSTAPSDYRWYTLQTLSNNESKAKRLLEKAIKDEEMGDFIAEILMPVKTVKEFRNGKKRESEMTATRDRYEALRKRFADLGMDVTPISQAALADTIRAEAARFKTVIEQTGVKVN